MKRTSARNFIALVFICYLLFFFIFPLFAILKYSFSTESAAFTLQNYLTFFSNEKILHAFTNSLEVSSYTTVIATLISFIFALGIARLPIAGKSFYRAMIFLPLAAPSIIQALALISLFGNNGLVTAKLLSIESGIYGKWGIVISEVLYCLPHSFVILFTTLSSIDMRIDEASRSLGASFSSHLFRVIIPNARYGLISAAALTFNLTITDFGNPVVIGGDYNVLATEIYAQVANLYRFDLGATVSVMLLVPSVIAFALNQYFSKRNEYRVKGSATFIPTYRGPLLKFFFTGFCSTVSLFIALVFITVIFSSFVTTWPYDFSLTLKHYNFPTLAGYSALTTSIYISLMVAVLGSTLTLVGGYLVETLQKGLSRVLYFLSVMPAAVPGIVLGLGYILAFNQPWYFFYGTAAIVVINVLTHNFPLGTLASISNFKNIDPSLVEAGKSLGANELQVFTRVLFPLSWATFSQNFLYFFIRSMTTISAVIFLVSAMVHLAAVDIVMLDNDGFTASANAMTTCILLVVFLAMGLAKLVEKLRKTGLKNLLQK